jgi:uracil phosphoribosyltransferase
VWVGGCDKGVDDKGMIKPGLGDIGDRLFMTLGK